jgi:F-type H+-transporting ATPase subunit b
MTEHGIPHASLGDLLLPTINFAIFAGVLVRFLRGPIREFFRARTERLREALEAGARARRDARALRAALQREMENLPALRAGLREDLRATAEHERDTLLALAHQAADRIRTDASLLGEHEVAAARQGLRAEVIEETIRQATTLLRNAVRPEDQQRFVRDFVERAGTAS